MHFSPNDTNYLASLRLANFHCKQRLDWMKAYLVYSPQNVRLFTLPFCLETEKSVDSSLVCM